MFCCIEDGLVDISYLFLVCLKLEVQIRTVGCVVFTVVNKLCTFLYTILLLYKLQSFAVELFINLSTIHIGIVHYLH
jgi:hypothetical protein